MFKKSLEERLSTWAEFRKSLEQDPDPLQSVINFWSQAPQITHNHKIDPFNSKQWPTPWEIIAENRYDDFTLAIMISLTLKLTNRFKKDQIQIKTMVDRERTRLYNLVVMNDEYVLNYNKDSIVKTQDIDDLLYMENVIDINFPR